MEDEESQMELKKKTQIELAAEGLRIFDSYSSSPYLSIKHTSYFHVYEELLSPYIGQPITFVEVGVYNGGSLFMWRHFFGEQARIIGVDLNPDARRWENEGFEIWIGNQSNPDFWAEFLNSVGEIDIFLDDGGHSNSQQIQTVVSVAPSIRDNGLVLVEDTHTSYMTQFGNPSKRSFVNFAFDVVDSINSRFPEVSASNNSLNQYVSSVSFFESIVAFHINRGQCFISQPTTNEGQTQGATDYRHHETRSRVVGRLRESLIAKFSNAPENSVLRKVSARTFSWMLFLQNRREDWRMRAHFGKRGSRR
jgi:hypothetical protein